MSGKLNSLYCSITSLADKVALPVLPKKFHNFWHGPTGPKTVFFWAPAFKWTLVLASIGDLARPADKLSISQSASLFATGLIWSRYSVIIIPRNYGLLSVNIFVALTNLVQLTRAYKYQLDQKAKESADK